MKKTLFFLLINNVNILLYNAAPILPKLPPAPSVTLPPVITPAKGPTPIMPPAVMPVAKLPTPPILPAAKPFPQPPMLPAKGPIAPTVPVAAPAPIMAMPPTMPFPGVTPPPVQPFQPKPAPTVAPVQTTPTTSLAKDLPSIVIHNLSKEPATLTNPIAIINSKATPITIPKPITISTGKHEIHLSISISLDSAPSFGGYTSITINGTPIKIIHPKTTANYFGNSTIYIDNVNGQWKMVHKPKKKSTPDKATSPKKSTGKQSSIKPVAKAALNLQAKAKKAKSSAAKAARDSVVPPMPSAPKIIKTSTTVPAKQ